MFPALGELSGCYWPDNYTLDGYSYIFNWVRVLEYGAL